MIDISVLNNIIHAIFSSENITSLVGGHRISDTTFKNVHTDVQFLTDVGLIKLTETGDGRKGLKPVAKYSGIELDLVA